MGNAPFLLPFFLSRRRMKERAKHLSTPTLNGRILQNRSGGVEMGISLSLSLSLSLSPICDVEGWNKKRRSWLR